MRILVLAFGWLLATVAASKLAAEPVMIFNDAPPVIVVSASAG